jgi:hypothetical protein
MEQVLIFRFSKQGYLWKEGMRYLTCAPGPEPERQAELNAAIGSIGRRGRTCQRVCFSQCCVDAHHLIWPARHSMAQTRAPAE